MASVVEANELGGADSNLPNDSEEASGNAGYLISFQDAAAGEPPNTTFYPNCSRGGVYGHVSSRDGSLGASHIVE